MLVAMIASGCADTGQHAVDFPVHAAGVENGPFTSGAWTVTIDEAKIGFGPLYMCATEAAAAQFCPTARAEWLGTASIDGLDPSLQMLGDARGVSGGVGSLMFDYGRTWLLTLPRPIVDDGAPEGHSLVLRGHIQSGAMQISFEALVDIDAAHPGESAIGGNRTAHALDGTEALVVHVDPIAWARRIDFDGVAALDDGTGHASIAIGSAPYESLVLAMRTAALPTFEWVSR